jgi:hypothetical protein
MMQVSKTKGIAPRHGIYVPVRDYQQNMSVVLACFAVRTRAHRTSGIRALGAIEDVYFMQQMEKVKAIPVEENDWAKEEQKADNISYLRTLHCKTRNRIQKMKPIV